MHNSHYTQYFQDENPIEKATEISSAIVDILLRVCECPYSLEYVTHSQLLCGSNENEVIYQANLLNTDGETAADLKRMVQLWVDNAPAIMVGGTLQKVDSYCQVDVTEVGRVDECSALNPTTPTVATAIEFTREPSASSSHSVAIITGAVGGGVLTIFLMLVVIVVVVCSCKRRGTAGNNFKEKTKTSFKPM